MTVARRRASVRNKNLLIAWKWQRPWSTPTLSPRAKGVATMSIAEIAVPALHYYPTDTDAALPTVLIVEDERKLLWSLIEQFRAMHIAPFTASGGYEAIRIASERRPDLILLDGLLPEMHGFEIAR